jgi:hypothetical protein
MRKKKLLGKADERQFSISIQCKLLTLSMNQNMRMFYWDSGYKNSGGDENSLLWAATRCKQCKFSQNC